MEEVVTKLMNTVDLLIQTIQSQNKTIQNQNEAILGLLNRVSKLEENQQVIKEHNKN